ncbi:hypothetical protein M3Y97_00556600 [Aphelenchoides bicaudatus]|nr:hypothetical protein M3Y97_00556600 [Aphelenchoides bicaudatus]
MSRNTFGGGNYRDRGSSYGGNSYGRNSQRGNSYGGNSYGGNSYGGNSYGGNSYGGNSYGGGDRRDRNNFAGAGLRDVDWKSAQLKELKKNIYTESPIVSSRSEAVTLEGKQVPRPVFEFNEAGLPQEIVDLLYKNYQQPTTIQAISWPVALSGRDMISIAKTGSGKTLGFLLPGIMHIMAQPQRRVGEGPSILIMLPTRELAQQVAEVAKEYVTAMGYSYGCLYGGESKGGQASTLRRGIDICIATPGRLLDFMEAGNTTMSRCSYLVLDEADRMLDMGFEPQIRKIVSQIRPDRQTLMFSATWPKDVRNLAKDFQTDPVFLNVGSLELAANHNIQQIVEIIEEHGKQKRLFEILKELLADKEAKIIIFVDTKRKADDLTREMRRDKWPALCIHGDKQQRERNWVLGEFKSGKSPILLATDVAARGLDVENIKTVINYDYPNNSEDYVHRIGRTGRRDKKGTAYTFFSSTNAPKARDLIKVLEEASQKVPQELSSFARVPKGNGRKRKQGGGFIAKRGRFDYGNAPRW